MSSQTTNRFLSKSFIIFILVLLLLIVAGVIGWNMVKYKFIKGKVRSAVYEKTNGLYTIRYDKMDLDEAGGYLHVTNLQIIPDTAKFRRMIADKENPGLVLALTVPELKITGVKTPEAMINKTVSGRRLEINNAEVTFYYAKTPPDTTGEVPKQEMYRQLLGDLNVIQVDSVDVTHVELAFVGMLNNRKTITASNISLHLRDVLIDSLHRNDSSRFFFAKHVQLTGDEGLVKNKSATYFYAVKGFEFSTAGNIFSVKTLSVDPQLSEPKFAAYSKVQNDRFNISFNNVALKHINLQHLMNTDIIADSLVIREASVKVFRDMSYPRGNVKQVKKFPHMLLGELPVTLSLKKLVVRNAFIEYKEKNPKSDYSGKVQFVHANAVISNITNEAARLKADNHCLLSFNASFLGMAPMHADLNMLLNNQGGAFTFSGFLKGFEASQLNVLIEPMGLARIEKGRVNDVRFNFAANSRGSNGKLTLLYEDLKLTLLKKDSAENTLKKKKLVSFIANLVVKNANPLRKQPVRVADVHYVHDANRSFFNLMWKSVFTGVKQSAGM
jgi:hypothetical protein